MALSSAVRNMVARVELYEGSTLVDTFTQADRLISFNREATSDNTKFFGFGILRKINLKLIDQNRELDITTAHTLDIYCGDGNASNSMGKLFRVTEVHRDEKTNQLSITAYDALHFASDYTVKDLDISVPYTINKFALAIGKKLGIPNTYTSLNSFKPEEFNLNYPEGANFDGTETLREALDYIAEATQTVYYLNSNGNLQFARLTNNVNAYSIGKDQYYDLSEKTNRRLVEIVSVTELGDNVSANLGVSGTTQYVRENPFWNMREDIATLVNNALTNVGGMTIAQFDMEWRCSVNAPLGCRFDITAKDGSTITTWYLNGSMEYDGSLSERVNWSYEDTDEATSTNSATIGDAINKTVAKVDKVNKQIDLMVTESSSDREHISNLEMDITGIHASVKDIEDNIKDSFDNVNEDLDRLQKQVEATISSEEINFRISEAIKNDVEEVTTSTGFTFNKDGLEVNKSDSEIKTTITEDGLTVYRRDEATLIANNEGVLAEDLHATTYLIIGNNSRFEDWGSDRTACFWIGGVE